MVGLLDLPLELREPILLDVILDTTQQQPNDPDSAKCSEGYEVMTIPGNLEPWDAIRFESLHSHAMALLHVNQQIRDEVIDLMPRRLGQRLDDAKVDALFVENIGWNLWATWLSAPFPTKSLNTVHAQIRAFQIRNLLSATISHPDVSTSEDCKHWVYPGCAGMFLNFLTRCLRLGHNSLHQTRRITGAGARRISSRTIQNLVINIPLQPDQHDSRETRVRCMRCGWAEGDISSDHGHRMIPSGKRAALTFAQSLHKQLLQIFETVPTSWRSIRFPRTVFQCIGSIHLHVEGRLFASLDLGQILAKLPHSEEWNKHGFSRAQFFHWKRAAEAKRKAFWFPLIRQSVQEHELVGSVGIIASILSTRGESLVREVTTLSEGEATSSRQSEVDEVFAFRGNAMLVQEDGNTISGNATFYSPFNSSLLSRVALYSFQLSVQRFEHHVRRHHSREFIEEQAKDGEIVLFTGEAIVFRGGDTATSITSGDARFYGPGGKGSAEQPRAIGSDSPQAKEAHRGT